MTIARKLELKQLASELLSKVGNLMTPASVATCETVIEEDSWRHEGCQPRLMNPDAERSLVRIKNLYFSQLIS